MNIFNHIGPDLRQLIIGAEIDQDGINKGILRSKIVINTFQVFFNNFIFPLYFLFIGFWGFFTILLFMFILYGNVSGFLIFSYCCFSLYIALIVFLLALMIYKVISFNNFFRNNYNLIIDLTSTKRYMRVLVNTVSLRSYTSHKDFFYIDLDNTDIEYIELIRRYRFNFSLLFLPFPVVFRDVLFIKLSDNYHINPLVVNFVDLSRGIFLPLGRNRFKTTILLKYLSLNGQHFIVIPIPMSKNLSYEQNINYLSNLLSNYLNVPVYFSELKDV